MPDRVTHFFLFAISLTIYPLLQKLRSWRKRIQIGGRRPHLILTGLGQRIHHRDGSHSRTHINIRALSMWGADINT
ncbi:hypothetical protein AXF42_Ash019720 [Apostasia shenzhenica]|uniref:Uncharacterized protein n=1 Tax=Apostasia shenzhenica TaxID=1088818 RepID=A0A2H9ZRP3_9ASPA|nr:hypothetical protein AXF42_Ash019720 [Apostasia shenzhenica]